MANIKSAIKRVQIAERNRLRNKAYKSAVRTLTKKYFQAVDAYVSEPTSPEAESAIKVMRSAAVSKIDRAVKRGVYHPNSGDRKKSRLDRYYKSATESLSSPQ
ncbi:MAG: 30S ribosomal protein S20 [Cyanophyceae cyanobacterium]